MRLLSEGVPAIRIARDCKVTERSVAAIAKREREEITERKKSLAGLMSNIAEIGGANVERKIGKASVRDAIIGTGVAIDKMLALTGQMPGWNQIANIQMPSPEEREEINRTHSALDEITRLLHKREPLSVKEELMVKALIRSMGRRQSPLNNSGLERFPAALIQSRSFDFSSGVPARNIARFGVTM